MERIRKKTSAPKPRDEYLVVFIDLPDRRWWDYVFHTRPGFRHAFCLYWDAWAKRWLMLDWRQSKLELVMLYTFEAEKVLAQVRAMGGTVVRYIPAAPVPETAGTPFSYCSNLIARYLGIGWHLVLTPYQLYLRVLKAGGQVVYSWRDPCENRKSPSSERRGPCAEESPSHPDGGAARRGGPGNEQDPARSDGISP